MTEWRKGVGFKRLCKQSPRKPQGQANYELINTISFKDSPICCREIHNSRYRAWLDFLSFSGPFQKTRPCKALISITGWSFGTSRKAEGWNMEIKGWLELTSHFVSMTNTEWQKNSKWAGPHHVVWGLLFWSPWGWTSSFADTICFKPTFIFTTVNFSVRILPS